MPFAPKGRSKQKAPETRRKHIPKRRKSFCWRGKGRPATFSRPSPPCPCGREGKLKPLTPDHLVHLHYGERLGKRICLEQYHIRGHLPILCEDAFDVVAFCWPRHAPCSDNADPPARASPHGSGKLSPWHCRPRPSPSDPGWRRHAHRQGIRRQTLLS